MPAKNKDSNSEFTLEQFLAIQEGRVLDAFETLLFLEPTPKVSCPNCSHPLTMKLWGRPIVESLDEWSN